MSGKIVVLTSHTPSLFWFRMDMMREFMSRGYEIYALGNEDEAKWRSPFAEHGIFYRQIYVSRNGMNPLQDKKTLDSIKQSLKTIMPDKIFTYQAKTVIYGSIAAKSLGIKEVYPLIAGIGSVFLSNSLKSKCVRLIMVALYKRAVKKCPAVFFQNRDDEEVFRKHGIVKNQKIVFLHGSGVNLDRFTESELPEKPAFLCISRLIKDKGVKEYLEACRMLKKRYPETRCMLVGPFDTNPSAISLEELQPFIDDGSVEYFGEQKEVKPFIAQCSVFVLPSYREGTPKTNLEAMACGRAVITTDAPGCRETVRNGENGFLVSVKDVDSLCEKMIWCVENKESVSSLGHRGRVMAEELFDVKKVNEAICRTMNI